MDEPWVYIASFFYGGFSMVIITSVIVVLVNKISRFNTFRGFKAKIFFELFLMGAIASTFTTVVIRW